MRRWGGATGRGRRGGGDGEGETAKGRGRQGGDDGEGGNGEGEMGMGATGSGATGRQGKEGGKHIECLGGMRLQFFLTLFTRATPGTPAGEGEMGRGAST